jgi:hypothetical protein
MHQFLLYYLLVRLSLCLTKQYAMKTDGGADVQIHIFLTSALAGGEWSASCHCRFTSGERDPGTHWIGGLVDSRAGLKEVEKREFLILPGLEIRPLGHPTPRKSLYRLSYPGSLLCFYVHKYFVSAEGGRFVAHVRHYSHLRERSPLIATVITLQ